MNNAVNGWSLISKWLGIRQKRQKYLAEVLGVSSSAVSQYKRGNLLLNGEQMKIIAETLHFSQKDIDDYYALVSNARFAHGRIRDRIDYKEPDANDSPGDTSPEIRDEPGEYYAVPRNAASACLGRPYGVIEQQHLLDFEPLLESFDAFAKNSAARNIFLPVSINGCVALRLNSEAVTPGLLSESTFLIDCHHQPEGGDMTAFQLFSGEAGVLIYQFKDGELSLISNLDHSVVYSWPRADAVKAVKWLYPVRAVFSQLKKM